MLQEKKQWDELEFIIFNTPKKLNLQKLFPNFSEVLLHKIYFIIHQCNYWHSEGKSYNLDVRNHHWFLSLTTNEVTAIKDILVNNFIIRCTRHGSQGLSALYTIVEPYDIKDLDNVYQHWYYLKQSNCPLHVQRYVADKGAVRNRETTSWVKAASTSKRKVKANVQPLEVQINDKDAYIKLLEATLTANNIALPIMNSTPAIPEPEYLTGVCEPLSAPEVLKAVQQEVAPTAQTLEAEAKPVDRAKQFLANLKVQTLKSETPKPQKALTALNTDVQRMEDFLLVNSNKYKRATQLLGFMERFKMERRLQELVAEGYQGSETFNTETWILTFEIDASTRTVTLSGVLDAELVA